MNSTTTPPIGTLAQWAALSDRARAQIHYFFPPTTRPNYRGALNGYLTSGEGVALPDWAREILLAVLHDNHVTKSPQDDAFDDAFDDAPDELVSGDDLINAKPAAMLSSEGPAPGLPDIIPTRFRVSNPCPDGYWAGPNSLLRTAIFSSSKGTPGAYGTDRITSLSHTRLEAKGTRLNQWDLDVYLAVIHALRYGGQVDTTARQLLRNMLRGDSTRDVESLMTSLSRLHGCQIDVSIKYRNTHKRRSWTGTLINFELAGEPKSRGGSGQRIRLSLDPKLTTFFGHDFTWFEIKDRSALRQHRLAAGLFSFYSTHAHPFPMPVVRLRDLLGVAVANKEFERLLRAALNVLVQKGLMVAWKIEDGKLHVSPKLTPTKAAYLAKRGLTPAVPNTASVPAVKTEPATVLTASPQIHRQRWFGQCLRGTVRAASRWFARLGIRGCILKPPVTPS
jgi:hypothetical protein